MKVRSPLLSLALVFFASLNIHAQTTWVGSVDDAFSTLANWSGGAPTDSNLLFGSTAQPFIRVDSSVAVKSLTFSGPAYTFSTDNGSILSIDSGGINVAQATGPIDFGAPLSVQLLTSQTWTIDGVLHVAGPITNADATNPTALTKTGTGTLILGGNSNFNGGVLLQQGALLVSSGSTTAGGTITGGSLGIGLVTIEGNSIFGAINSGVTLANPISLGSGAVLTSGNGHDRESGLTLSGPVTAASSNMLVNLSSNNPIIFSGSLDGPADTAFRFASTSTNALDGAVFASAIGANVVSVTADRSALFFA
ncbi:MAG TPA: hypothetical protein VL069_00775, partial [Opitutus sp.]|nr:hypothetical protein [Opitutus sp.]